MRILFYTAAAIAACAASLADAIMLDPESHTAIPPHNFNQLVAVSHSDADPNATVTGDGIRADLMVDNPLIKQTLHNLRPRPCMLDPTSSPNSCKSQKTAEDKKANEKKKEIQESVD